MDEQDGVQDAAILLMSLGEEEAAEVFKQLSPKEVQKLGETIARMKAVSRERVDQVVFRFTETAAQQSLLVSDTGDYVRSVLRRALGDDKAGLLIDRILQGGDVSGIGRGVVSGWEASRALEHFERIRATEFFQASRFDGTDSTTFTTGYQ